MSSVRISIVIAALNEGDRLWRTVRSCYATTRGLDCELVVVDDASTDGCVDEVRRRFPGVRVITHRLRRGASAARDHAARLARGKVLVFLDGHTRPMGRTIERLVSAVEERAGDAILQARILSLDARTWRLTQRHVGYGYTFDLKTFQCGWVWRTKMWRRGTYFESPSLAGAGFALTPALYRKVRGFDPNMVQWGYEDNDLGLRAWLLGYPILLDPRATVGHCFRKKRDNYAVALDSLVVNQLRLARKCFSEEVWKEWATRCRRRTSPRRWRKVWRLYKEGEASAERERRYILRHQVHDDYWYARKFRLEWPKDQKRSRPDS